MHMAIHTDINIQLRILGTWFKHDNIIPKQILRTYAQYQQHLSRNKQQLKLIHLEHTNVIGEFKNIKHHWFSNFF